MRLDLRLNFTTLEIYLKQQISNLEIQFFGPLRSTLGPLLGPEIVPKPHQGAPEEAPSARDSGEPVPGAPQ